MKSHAHIILAGVTACRLAAIPSAAVAAEGRPAQARAWDAIAEQAYLSRPDADWDGINDDEERLGTILWGEVEQGANAWVSGAGADDFPEWIWGGVDDDAQPADLPFSFPWGTQSWSRVWVGVNGTLGFGRGQTSPYAKPLPSPAAGAWPFFGVLWDQLYLEPSAGGRIWHSSPGAGRFAVGWENLWVGGATDSVVSLQAELKSDGEMVWRYRDLDPGAAMPTNGVVGVQRDGAGWWLPSTALRRPLSLRVAALDGLAADNPDTDGDGVADGVELGYYRPDAPYGRFLDPTRPDNPGDRDRDGLGVTAEYLHGRLDPFRWDSDGDMLSDGYEVATRLLAADATGIHGLHGDADGDGVSNLMERLHRTQPRLKDSDGDGRGDAEEIAAGSNPAGAGEPPPSAAWLAPVRFSLGDPGLDGRTEAYEMFIDSISGDTRGFTFQNTVYGQIESCTLPLVIGARYQVRLRHLGSVASASGSADPDYEAGVEGVDGTAIALSGSPGMLGRHLSSVFVPPAAEPVDTNTAVTVWVQSRVLPDGTVPVMDPALVATIQAWSAGRLSSAGPVPEAELANPGIVVLPAYSSAMGAVLPAKIRVGGLGVAEGATRWLRFSDTAHISYRLSSMFQFLSPGDAMVQIPGDATIPVDVELRPSDAWPAGTTVTVDFVVKNDDGMVLSDSRDVKLIGQIVTAIGDSMTYGLRRLNDGTYETPNWHNPWIAYPSHESWTGYSGTWSDIAFQGSRGYLRRDLTSKVEWAGHPANGHGPDHCGYPGARTTDIIATLADASRTYPLAAVDVGACEMVLIYFIGLNDVVGGRSAGTIYGYWTQGLNNILAKRAGKGRTIIVAVTLPRMSSTYSGYSSAKQDQLKAFNAKVRSHVISAPHACYVVADAELVPHDSNDDGLHFMATGYERVEQIIRQALLTGLQRQP